MVTASELYLLAMTVMALVALAAAIPVLLGIVREGRERLQQDGPAQSVADPDVDDSDDADGVRCRHCGTENEPGYAYCQACSRSL